MNEDLDLTEELKTLHCYDFNIPQHPLKQKLHDLQNLCHNKQLGVYDHIMICHC